VTVSSIAASEAPIVDLWAPILPTHALEAWLRDNFHPRSLNARQPARRPG